MDVISSFNDFEYLYISILIFEHRRSRLPSIHAYKCLSHGNGPRSVSRALNSLPRELKEVSKGRRDSVVTLLGNSWRCEAPASNEAEMGGLDSLVHW